MEIKLLEIRDRGTFIAAMALKLFSLNAVEVFLLRRAGYGKEQITGEATGLELRCPTCEYTLGAELAENLIADNPGKAFRCPNTSHIDYLQTRTGPKIYDGEPYIILVKLDGVEANYDPFSWPNFRTLGNAHQHLIAHWSEIQSGDVLDVEFILGETTAPKKSERSL